MHTCRTCFGYPPWRRAWSPPALAASVIPICKSWDIEIFFEELAGPGHCFGVVREIRNMEKKNNCLQSIKKSLCASVLE